ncbi:unnamed protein product, partial [Gulo gulo]
DSLEEGSKWWIGQNLKHLGKHRENNNPGIVGPWPPERPSCTYLSRNSNWISSKMDLCPLEHSFICQADAFPDQAERHGMNSHLHGRPEKTRGEVPIMRSERTAVTRRVMAVTSAPTSQPLPATPALTTPALETQSRQAVAEVTSSRREDSQAEVFTTNPQTSLQDAPDQVSTENK